MMITMMMMVITISKTIPLTSDFIPVFFVFIGRSFSM